MSTAAPHTPIVALLSSMLFLAVAAIYAPRPNENAVPRGILGLAGAVVVGLLVAYALGGWS